MINRIEIRHAFRKLGRMPGTVILTLMLVTASLAISIVGYVLLRATVFVSLPVPEGESLAVILDGYPSGSNLLTTQTLGKLRSAELPLASLGGYVNQTMPLQYGDQSDYQTITYCDWELFALTPIEPILGRAIQAADQALPATPVVVIREDYWREIFLADSTIVNRELSIGGRRHRVIGIMPANFRLPVSGKIWCALPHRYRQPDNTEKLFISTFAKLLPGESHDSLNRILRDISHELSVSHNQSDHRLYATTFQAAQLGGERGIFVTLVFIIVFAIFLMAGINSANLLFARAAERFYEYAIRMALGAPPHKLWWQALWESTLLTSFGGLMAILLAGWILEISRGWFTGRFADGMAYWWRLEPGIDTVIFAAIMILLMILLSGGVSAWRLVSGDFNQTLREGSGSVGSKKLGRYMRAIIVAEIFLMAMVIFIGTSALILLDRINTLGMEMVSSNRISLALYLPDNGGTKAAAAGQAQNLYSQIRQRPRISGVMLKSPATIMGITRDNPDTAKSVTVFGNRIYGDLAAGGLDLMAGENFVHESGENRLSPVIISHSLAKHLWPGASKEAVGEQLFVEAASGNYDACRVSGICRDVVNGNPLAAGQTKFAIYRPLDDLGGGYVAVLINYRNSRQSVVDDITQVLITSHVDLLIRQILSPQEIVKLTEDASRIFARIALWCILLAVVLAASGIYGLVAVSVMNRHREISLRRAIGAGDHRIIRQFLSEGRKHLLIALGAAGIVITLILFGFRDVIELDYSFFWWSAIATVLLIVPTTMLASYFPARQAIQAEPATALRHE